MLNELVRIIVPIWFAVITFKIGRLFKLTDDKNKLIEEYKLEHNILETEEWIENRILSLNTGNSDDIFTCENTLKIHTILTKRSYLNRTYCFIELIFVILQLIIYTIQLNHGEYIINNLITYAEKNDLEKFCSNYVQMGLYTYISLSFTTLVPVIILYSILNNGFDFDSYDLSTSFLMILMATHNIIDLYIIGSNYYFSWWTYYYSLILGSTILLSCYNIVMPVAAYINNIVNIILFCLTVLFLFFNWIFNNDLLNFQLITKCDSTNIESFKNMMNCTTFETKHPLKIY